LEEPDASIFWLVYPENGGSRFLKMSVKIYQTTRHHIPELSILLSPYKRSSVKTFYKSSLLYAGFEVLTVVTRKCMIMVWAVELCSLVEVY
jgi:hypothetical protein